MTDEVEFPDGLPDSPDWPWPLSAQGHVEMSQGGPVWAGSFTPADGERAERLFRGWRAYTRRDAARARGLWLVPPNSSAEQAAAQSGWVRLKDLQ